MATAASRRDPSSPLAGLWRLSRRLAGGSVRVAAQQPQGPGQIRPRPGTGREPEFPPPKITDYKPKSTLVVPEHPVPRAKFPVVDIHGHPPPLDRIRRAIQTVLDAMDKLNIRVHGAGQRRLRRSPEAAARCDRGQRSQGSLRRVHERQLARDRARDLARRAARSSKPTSRPARSGSARSARTSA